MCYYEQMLIFPTILRPEIKVKMSMGGLGNGQI